MIMPTKPNRAGNQQNYVPAGNGDASGEYGDNATGSNIHFVNFKKPDESSYEKYTTDKKRRQQIIQEIIDKGGIKVKKENRAEELANSISDKTYMKILESFNEGRYKNAWEKMTSLSAIFSSRHQQEMEKFFSGGFNKVSNQYFTFKRVLNNDEIIIVTNNVRRFKEDYVLWVDNNKVIYLKDWQIKPVKNYDLGDSSYAVKLNRKYFKPYTLRFESRDLMFNKEDTFDSLMEVAKQQEKKNIKWAIGSL